MENNIPQAEGFRYSRGTSKYDNAPAQKYAADFGEFREAVLNDRSSCKGMAYICSALSFGPHDDVKKHLGDKHYRLRSHAEARKYFPLDFDGFRDNYTYRATLTYMDSYSALAYTTASHTDDAPRARAIIELTRNVTRAEGILIGAAFKKQMQKSLGLDAIKFDPSVYHAEQPCYTPVTTSEVFRFDGEPLDVDTLLKEYSAITLHKTTLDILGPVPAYIHGHSGNLSTLCSTPETPENVARLKAALTCIPPDCDRVTWRNVVWSIQAHGWDCGTDLAREWSMAGIKYDEADFRRVVQDYRP